MPRLGRVVRPLFAAPASTWQAEAQGTVLVTASGRARQLWFVNGAGERQLQTEAVGDMVSSNWTVDVAASLRRTPYLRVMAARLVEKRPRRALVLGLGGGVLPAALRAGGCTKVVVVEREPVVVDVARRVFGMSAAEDAGWLELRLCSAEDFVRGRSAADFDACGVDMFVGPSNMLPRCLLDQDFITDLRSILTPGARVVQNALAHSGSVVPSPKGRRKDIGTIRCNAWRRGAAPSGPLFPAVFPRDSAEAVQLAQACSVYRDVFGGVAVRSPCSWSSSRVLEADIGISDG